MSLSNDHQENKFFYDLQLQNIHLEMDKVFLNVGTCITKFTTNRYKNRETIKSVFREIQNVTNINRVLSLIKIEVI